MTAWTHYARCLECGVDAGRACRDLDDREALEVCDGRRLVIDDAPAKLAATRDRRRVGMSERTRQRRASGEVGAPQMVPCQHCGAPARLWGFGLSTGRAWCPTDACQRARRARASREGQRRETEPIACSVCGGQCPRGRRKFCGTRCQQKARLVVAFPEVVPCHWCAAPCPLNGRGLRAYMPTCSDLACRRARRRVLQAASRARKRSQITADPAS